MLVGAMSLPGSASAQLLFDWGGQEKVNDSGRQAVRINADAKPGEIIVSFSDRKLYLMTAPGRAVSYPVAIPREQDRWEGRTSVSQKRENPSWTPTPSMLKENPRLPRWVPGGHPLNPLGNRALYLGSSYYRIHGTDAPWTIGTAVSKGCIRMYNKDALDVYERTKVGAKVLVTWKNFEIAPDKDQPEVASRQDAPAVKGGVSRPAAVAATATAPGAASAAQGVSRPAGDGGAPTGQGSRLAESRYSDIFGTPEPPAARRPASPASAGGEGQPARSSRPLRSREAPAEAKATPAPRRGREMPSETAESKSEAATSSAAAAAGKKETRQKPAAVETGALPERPSRVKAAAPDKAASQPVAAARPAEPVAPPAPSAADIATKALAAAERAAAAAERAAAAAERAERAALARPVAPAVVPAAATVAAPAPPPAAATQPAGGSD